MKMTLTPDETFCLPCQSPLTARQSRLSGGLNMLALFACAAGLAEKI
jgi:hypothetical protein